MTAIEIQVMKPAEMEEAATVLSHAMLRNPIHVAVYQGESEAVRRQIEERFMTMLKDRTGEVFLAKQGAQIIGICRSYVCHGGRSISKEVEDLIAANEPELSSFQDRDDLWRGLWASRDPAEKHSHLGPIGVLPDFQSLGVGTRLMERYCKFVDKRNLAAYLEADKLKNVRFYERFGFITVDAIEILGVMNYFMWREVQD
ncbi:MAG: GNAT family N-acetyltransferase [Anaerolineales bacterium]|nr:GNAT family N-acetyltransferase [Anaerolineales bacterium]